MTDRVYFWGTVFTLKHVKEIEEKYLIIVGLYSVILPTTKNGRASQQMENIEIFSIYIWRLKAQYARRSTSLLSSFYSCYIFLAMFVCFSFFDS